MYKTALSINEKIALRNKEINKTNKSLEKNSVLNTFQLIKSSTDFRKTNNNFKSNLTLSPLCEESIGTIGANNFTKRNILCFNFNKAPSRKDNYYKINKLIRLKKNERMKELEKIHNKILISESELYRNNLYITASEFKTDGKFIKLNRNLSCNELSIKKKKNPIKINKSKSVRKINNYSKTTYNFNSPKKINSSILKNEKIISVLTNYNDDIKTKYALKSTSKMKMQIINMLHNDFGPMNLLDFESKLTKYRMFQNLQSKNVSYLSLNNEFIKTGYINRLTKLKNKVIKIYDNYSQQMHLYLQFLTVVLDREKMNYRENKSKIMNLCSFIEKIVLRIIYKQSELEYLVEIRNFLLRIKNIFDKKEKPAIYYDLLLIRDSKILLIEDLFSQLNFIKEIANKKFNKFISHFQKLKKRITDEDANINLNKNIIDNLDLGYNKVEIIFSSPDDFIKLLNNLTDKNLNLLNELQDTQKAKNNLERYYKKELNFFTKQNDIEYLNQEIELKTNIRDSLKEKYHLLNKRYLYFNNTFNKKLGNTNVESLKIKKNIPMYLDYKLNLDTFNRERYLKKLKNYQYKGLLLLEKLINMIKNFLAIYYDKEKFLENFRNRNRLYVLDINIKSITKEDAKTINSNILKATSIYAEICKYIIFKHKKLTKNVNNLQRIQEQQNIINSNKRIQKQLNEKEAKYEKDFEEKIKILEKTKKPIFYIEKKNSIENNSKRLKMKSERRKIKNKNFAKNEFNDLIKYDDDV